MLGWGGGGETVLGHVVGEYCNRGVCVNAWQDIRRRLNCLSPATASVLHVFALQCGSLLHVA